MRKLKVYLDTSVVSHLMLEIEEDVMTVARKMIEMGVLTQKSYDDCQHIGVEE